MPYRAVAGRIKSSEDLGAARKRGRGAARGPGDNALLHDLSCGRLDEIMEDGGAGALCLYRNLAAARKADPAVELCSECDPQGIEIREALNRSGAFLHAEVGQNLKRLGFDHRSELPVSAAPFLSDPSSQPGAIAWRAPQGSGMPLLKRSAFRGAVAASQDGSQRRNRTIDICASRQEGGSVCTTVVEVKRLDPDYVSWVFLALDGPPRGYSVVARSDKPDDGALRLMKVPKADPRNPDIYVQKKPLAPPGAAGGAADHGMDITYDPGSGYSHRGTSLYDAANQVLEGTFGLIVDAVTHQATAGAPNVPEECYLPVIVTTANLLACRYDPETLGRGRLGAPDMALRRVDSVIYHCPHPARTRFPDQIVATRSASQAMLAMRWPVLIATVKGLGDVLSRPLFLRGAAGAS